MLLFLKIILKFLDLRNCNLKDFSERKFFINKNGMLHDRLKAGRGNKKSKIARTFFVIKLGEISDFYGKMNEFFVKSLKSEKLFIFYSLDNS